MRSINDATSPMKPLSRAKSDFNLTASTHSLVQGKFIFLHLSLLSDQTADSTKWIRMIIDIEFCIETPRVRSTENQRKQTNTPRRSYTRKQLKALLPQRSVRSNWERLGCKGARQIK
jgi:hypothetical protein